MNGKKLLKLRLEMKLSRAKLVKLLYKEVGLDVIEGTILRWEMDENPKIDFDNLKLLAKFFGKDTNFFC